MNRFKVVNLLNLGEVESEIDTLISIAGNNPSDALVDEITNLIKVANSLGTSRSW